MSGTKFTVLPKRIFKFLKQKLSAFDQCNESADLKSRTPLDRHQRTIITLSPFKRKPFCDGKSFTPVLRYLTDPKFGDPKVAKIFWKAFPRTFRDDKRQKCTWATAANGTGGLRGLARGFRGKANNPASSPELVRERRPGESRRSPRRKVKECVEVAEQKLYTQETSPLKLFASMKRKRDVQGAEGESRPEPPPTQKCRLSCPLPPPEYSPPEKLEFLSKFQAPIVRFAALQSEFLPRHKPAEGKGFTMKTQSWKAKAHPRPESDFPEVARNSIKTKRSSFPWAKGLKQKTRTEAEPEMKALVLEPNNRVLTCKAVKVPNQIFKDEVLVQVAYSGVCSSDVFATEGKISCGDGPIILGQEISGKVYAVGSEVSHVAVGDSVAIDPFTACCVCRHCTRGLFSACLHEGLTGSIGVTKNGGWAEFVVVKRSQVHKIPEELGLDQATLLQPLSCILKAYAKLKLSHGTQILIQGLGLSGCLWASLLHHRGHRNVLVSDKSDKRTKQFETLDLKYAPVPPEDIRMYSADVIIECTGSPTFIEKSLNVLNPNGRMCFFGRPNPTAEVRCIPYEVVQKEITIFGTAGNSFCFSEAIDSAASMGRRYLDPRALGVRAFDLEDFREAFQLKKAGEISKILFKFDS